MPTVLVIGATGLIGKIVADQLLMDGYSVKALVRRKEKARKELPVAVELMEGDIINYNDVLHACRGVDFVHISTAGGNTLEGNMAVEYEGTLNVFNAAKTLPIKQITLMSGMGVNERNRHHPAEKAKYEAEQEIMKSGVNYTIFKPSFFMETLERFVQGNKAIIIGKQPHALHMIAARDLAVNVSKTYRLPEAVNKIFYVRGREGLLLQEALKRYIDVKHPGIKIMTVPIAWMQWLNRLFLRGKLSRVIGIMRILQKEGETGDPEEYFRLYGHHPTSFAEWLSQN